MLVLTRKPGESIIVGDKLVQFKILASSSHQVRVGIAAPKNLSVHREEIYAEIDSERTTLKGNDVAQGEGNVSGNSRDDDGQYNI